MPTNNKACKSEYRGRLAPSPTGLLHLGHARTFWQAQVRARSAGGTLLMRIEDLDNARSRPEFVKAIYEDLRWFGIEWEEGPDCEGSVGPYVQSERVEWYRRAFKQLQEAGLVYPCACSRQDVARAVSAPHPTEDEPVYPGTCRARAEGMEAGTKVNWRFRVPDGEEIHFEDGNCGHQSFVAGKDFGDFVVWRHDGVPSYQLACVVDDAWMNITEVVRGADLLRSTARQLLLYRAFAKPPPVYFHCDLMTDQNGVRLAKRNDALSLRALREQGKRPVDLRAGW